MVFSREHGPDAHTTSQHAPNGPHYNQKHFWSVAEAEDEEKGQFGVLEVQFVEEDPLAHLEKLRRQLPAKTVSLEKTQQYMERVKVSVAAERREAAKREQRRKKLIADEVVLSLDKERADRQAEMKSIMKKHPAAATMAFDDKIRAIRCPTSTWAASSRRWLPSRKGPTHGISG